MNWIPIILALLVIALIWRRHLYWAWCIWRAKTPAKKEISRMLYQLDARGNEEAAEKHVHNALLLKAREIMEREESNR